MSGSLSNSFNVYWHLVECVCVLLLIWSQRSPIRYFSNSPSLFSKSISVGLLVAVPPESSGSHTSLRSRLPAASNWKMELSGLEGYMNRDSLTPPFVWLRWIWPDSNTVAALRQGLHCGQIWLDTHSSKMPESFCTLGKRTAGIPYLQYCWSGDSSGVFLLMETALLSLFYLSNLLIWSKSKTLVSWTPQHSRGTISSIKAIIICKWYCCLTPISGVFLKLLRRLEQKQLGQPWG